MARERGQELVPARGVDVRAVQALVERLIGYELEIDVERALDVGDDGGIGVVGEVEQDVVGICVQGFLGRPDLGRGVRGRGGRRSLVIARLAREPPDREDSNEHEQPDPAPALARGIVLFAHKPSFTITPICRGCLAFHRTRGRGGIQARARCPGSRAGARVARRRFVIRAQLTGVQGVSHIVRSR
jgi:hypothetical protein